MAKITVGNKLYLYQLFSRELGIGKQTLESKVEEVLKADGIYPEDLECENYLELLEALNDFVKITVFKRGNVYATLLRKEEWDRLLEQAAQPEPAKKSARGGKPWKKHGDKKGPTPAKPRHKERPVVETTPEPEPKPEVEVTTEEKTAPQTETTPEVIDKAEDAPKAETNAVAQAETTAETPVVEEKAEAEAVTAEQAAPAPAPMPAAPQPSRASGFLSQGTKNELPQSLAQEVLCKDEILRLLYQIIPYGADPIAILDEDWRVARSTDAVAGVRSRVNFPLRYLHTDGITPMEATIKRISKSASGKHWALALIDGDDGTGTAHDALGIEGAPENDRGAWSDLLDARRAQQETLNPARELASFAQLGSWDAVLGSLATLAAPELWNFPGEGVGKASRYGILREYLSVTFMRIQHEHKLAISADESFAAFNTGLLTPFAEAIYACFSAQKGPLAWKFDGFCVAGSKELGAKLTANFDPLPQRATYLQTIDDVILNPERLIVLDVDALLTKQLDRLPRAFLADQLASNTEASEQLAATAHNGNYRALAHSIKNDPGLYRRMGHALSDAVDLARARTRTSYRTAVPAWDPSSNELRLLVPLSLVDDVHTDCALSLVRQPSGNYQGVSLLLLPRAYACARIISAEQPQWLLPTTVLAS